MSDSLASALSNVNCPEEGRRVLFAAVIYTALLDATGNYKGESKSIRDARSRSALAYFRGPVYQYHCETLGLEPILPPAVAQLFNKQAAEAPVQEPPQKEVAVTHSVAEILTKEKCMELHRVYMEKGQALTDISVVNGNGRRVSEITVSKYFAMYELPIRPRGGWTPETHKAALAIHGLTPADVQTKLIEYTRNCAVCNKPIVRKRPFAGSPEYTHCGSSECERKVWLRRKQDASTEKKEGVSDELVRELHARYLDGESLKMLAKEASLSWQTLEGAIRRAGLPKRDKSKATVSQPIVDPVAPLSSITKRNGTTAVVLAEVQDQLETAVAPIPELPEPMPPVTAVVPPDPISGLVRLDSLRDLVAQLEMYGAKVQVSGRVTVELEF